MFFRGLEEINCMISLKKCGGPNGSRTRVLALRGPRPRPLDDGTIFLFDNLVASGYVCNSW